MLSHVRLCDPMDYNRPASSAHEIRRQEYWRGLPFPSPGDLHDPGIKSGSPALEADFLPYEPPGKPLKWSFCKLFCFTGITELVSGTFSFKLRVVWFCTQSAAAAKLLQSCPTLSNPMDCSLPGSSVHGISHSINIKFIPKCQKTQFNFSKISITWDAGSLEKHKLVTKTPRDKWQVAEVPTFCAFSRMKPFPYVYCKDEYCCMSLGA